MENYLTTKEFADELGISRIYVRQMLNNGIIKSEKIGRDHFIPISEVEKVRARRTKRGPEPKAKQPS